jgi:hypothetical protein
MSQSDDATDYDRIYGGCLDLPVMKPLVRLALAERKRAWFWDGIDEPEHHFDALEVFDEVVKSLHQEYDAVLGPRIHLVGPPGEPLGAVRLVSLDFDLGVDGNAPEPLWRMSSGYEWTESALDRAARAYRRECGWDFAPGEAGMWLSCIVWTSCFGCGDYAGYTGNLIGFAVLHDRYGGGRRESVAHIWTAQVARRKGIARAMLQRARALGAREAERPWTDAGSALIHAVWPELTEVVSDAQVG